MEPGDEAPAEAPSTGEDICEECGGSGQVEGGTCPACGGSGKVEAIVGGG